MSPTPYTLTPGDGPLSPVVVSVPHAGTAVDPRDESLIVCDQRTMLRDADLYVDRLYAQASRLGATTIMASVSRYVLDLNRGVHETDTETCPDWDGYAPEPRPRGLIWRQSTEGRPVLGRPMTRAELQSRVDRVHTPYHQRLRALLDERRQRFGYAILLDGHSMPSVGRTGHSDDGVRRADVVPGNHHGKSCDERLTSAVMTHFESAGLDVRLNTPYSGGYITRHYGQPTEGIHAIQVELNRGLYMDEDTPAWDEARGARLGAITHGLVERLLKLDLS